jgi:hypothetical protein
MTRRLQREGRTRTRRVTARFVAHGAAPPSRLALRYRARALPRAWRSLENEATGCVHNATCDVSPSHRTAPFEARLAPRLSPAQACGAQGRLRRHEGAVDGHNGMQTRGRRPESNIARAPSTQPSKPTHCWRRAQLRTACEGRQWGRGARGALCAAAGAKPPRRWDRGGTRCSARWPSALAQRTAPPSGRAAATGAASPGTAHAAHAGTPCADPNASAAPRSPTAGHGASSGSSTFHFNVRACRALRRALRSAAARAHARARRTARCAALPARAAP